MGLAAGDRQFAERVASVDEQASVSRRDHGDELEASGFDAVLAVVPFTSPAQRSPQGFDCANGNVGGLVERLSLTVEPGLGYAVQVGGARGPTGAATSGALQLSLSFAPDMDRDGVADEKDRCPARAGTVNGCPPRIRAHTPYTWHAVAGGLVIDSPKLVSAPSGARVELKCSRGCSPHVLTFRPPALKLPGIAGHLFRSGSRIEIRVTKNGYIGAFIRATVKAGEVSIVHQCIPLGRTKPSRSCP